MSKNKFVGCGHSMLRVKQPHEPLENVLRRAMTPIPAATVTTEEAAQQFVAGHTFKNYGLIFEVAELAALLLQREEAATARAQDGRTKAAQDVLSERQRQITSEGWTLEHDDSHDMGELALAGGSYAIYAAERRDFKLSVHPDDAGGKSYVPRAWPHSWSAKWFKPNDAHPRKDLVKAAALILAEIERLDRAAIRQAPAREEGK